jgi:flagellar basal body-associated protein FliL
MQSEMKKVGTQAALADNLSMTRMLIRKGIFTYEELKEEKVRATKVAVHSSLLLPKVMASLTDDDLGPEAIEKMMESITDGIENYLIAGVVPE